MVSRFGSGGRFCCFGRSDPSVLIGGLSQYGFCKLRTRRRETCIGEPIWQGVEVALLPLVALGRRKEGPMGTRFDDIDLPADGLGRACRCPFCVLNSWGVTSAGFP